MNIDVEVVSEKVCLRLKDEGLEAPGGQEGGDGGQGRHGDGGQGGGGQGGQRGQTPHHPRVTLAQQQRLVDPLMETQPPRPRVRRQV